MDKAPDFGSGNCRFEFYHDREVILDNHLQYLGSTSKMPIYFPVVLWLSHKTSDLGIAGSSPGTDLEACEKM